MAAWGNLPVRDQCPFSARQCLTVPPLLPSRHSRRRGAPQGRVSTPRAPGSYRWGAEAVEAYTKGGNSLDFDGFATRPEGPDEAHVRRRERKRVGRGSPQIERPLPLPLQWPVGPDARVGQQPRYTRVVGNLVREVGLIQKQSSFWFQVQ